LQIIAFFKEKKGYKSINKKGCDIMVLLIAGILLFKVSGYFPYLTENIYSSFIYKIIHQSLNLLTSLFSFSLAEIVIVFSIIFTAVYTFQVFNSFVRKKEIKHLQRFFLNTITIVGIIYLAFQLLWGLNYNRLRLNIILDLDTKAPTQEELVSLCENLIVTANNLRRGLNEDEANIMMLPHGKRGALKIAYKGFKEASSNYPNLDCRYGKPKGIMLSKLMCYTGITGFFFPFTGEANVNMEIPDPFFPFVVAHELAHQIGFAREDEANFIAYVACINHPDIYFKYSGTLSALGYSMSALRKADRVKYNELLANYSEEVARDIKHNNEFWGRYTGPVEKVSNKINDTYLKTQNQKSGVKSYGAMVDLLIADRRKKLVESSESLESLIEKYAR